MGFNFSDSSNKETLTKATIGMVKVEKNENNISNTKSFTCLSLSLFFLLKFVLFS